MNSPIPSIPQPGRLFRTAANKGLRHVSDILAETPIWRLIQARTDDPNWPTAEDIARATWGLSQPRSERQQSLPLEPTP